MRQNEHRLQNVDPQRSCCSLGALAVQLYQQLIRAAEKRLKPMIGMAWAWGLAHGILVPGGSAVVSCVNGLLCYRGCTQRGKVGSELGAPFYEAPVAP